MRILGLDYGARRIGLALSDDNAKIAFPVGCLERKGPRQDLAALVAMIRERDVERIVIGLPLHMSGRAGDEAKSAQAFGRDLERAGGVAVDFLDERWSTREADRVREAARGSRSRSRRRDERKRGELDAAAASLILSTYLARRGDDSGAHT